MIRRMAGREIFERMIQDSQRSLGKLYPLRLVSMIEIGEGERHFTLRPSLTWTDRIDSLLIRHMADKERERESITIDGLYRTGRSWSISR